MGAPALRIKDPMAVLGAMDVFAGLDKPSLGQLHQHGRIVPLKPKELITFDPRRGEELCFLIEGQIAARRTRQAHGEVIALFLKNDVFSNAFLSASNPKDQPKLEALMASFVLMVREPILSEIMRRNASWATNLTARNQDLRGVVKVQSRNPSLRVIQNFFIEQNYNYAQTMRVIDLDLCIGCDGCERACESRHGQARLIRKGPTLGRLSFPVSCRTCVDHRCVDACGFDSIHVIEGEVKVSQNKCVGCTACKTACPNDVINMVEVPYTVDDFPKPLPFTDGDHQTNVPGLYLVGEAKGDALIKLAANAGNKAVEAIRKSIDQPGKNDGIFDVIVAGAGPAGLSAALKAMDTGLSYAIFDKGNFAETIQTYPRNKIVMAEPAHIPKYGKLWMENSVKEEMIEKWGEIIEKTQLPVRKYEGVTDIKKLDDGTFEVTTQREKEGNKKETYRARNVVIAIGTRGDPRKLGVPGESSPRVQYVLTEPADFAGKKVLVVGGGDSAVEAAMSLADEAGTTVTLSYRRDSFGRIKGGNRTRLEEYKADGRVDVVLESNIKEIRPDSVVIDVKGELREIPNDQIFGMLGANPPTKFFERIGIEIVEPGSTKMVALAESRGTRFYSNKCDHCAGFEDQACISACPTGAIFELAPSEVFIPVGSDKTEHVFREAPFREGLEDQLKQRRFRRVLPWLALLALVVTLVIALECALRRFSPELSFTHAFNAARGVEADVGFFSGTGLGFWLGVIGTSMMVLTALYPLNSRLGVFRRFAKTRVWLVLHIWAGLMGPAFVALHTNLKLNRWPSLAFWAMVLVVLSGVVGRFIYTSLRKGVALGDLSAELIETKRADLSTSWESGKGRTQIMRQAEILDQPKEAAHPIFAPISLAFSEVADFGRYFYTKRVLTKSVPDPAVRAETLEVFRQKAKAARRKQFLKSVEASVAFWRRLHLGLTALMFVIAAAHIILAMMFKVA